MDAGCAAAQQAAFKTEQDLITLPSLRGALEARGIGGLAGVGLSTVPGLLAVLFLMTALPVYLIGWIIGLVRGRRLGSQRRDWTLGWSRAAPWLAIVATLLAQVFLVGLAVALGVTVATNQMLLGLGAVPSAFRPLFTLPPLYLLLVICMLIATVALWSGRRRTLPGRIYYTALLVAALVTFGAFFSLGVMDLWHA